MTAAARRISAPRLASAQAADFTESRPRDFAAPCETIRLPCGRLVERVKRGARSHLYRLWEPLLGGNRYRVVRCDEGGREWGLAHTRRPPAYLDGALGYDAAVDHERREARRAMDLMRASVRELSRRDHRGQPGGIAEGIYEQCGELLLWSDPEVCAGLAESQRRTGA